MDLFLQILGAIFLTILIVVGLVVLLVWWKIRKLKRDLRNAAAGLKSQFDAIGPIVLPREFFRDGPMPEGVEGRRMIESRDVTPGGFAPEDVPILDRAVSEGFIREDERGWAVLVRDRVDDAERLAGILELDDAPVFNPPDERSGAQVLRDGPTRDAFAKLNAMRSEGDQFKLRGSIEEVDIYVHGG